jgi:hypothetical protein
MVQRLNSIGDRLLSSLVGKATAKACPAPWYTYGPCRNDVQTVTYHYYEVSDGLCLGPYTSTFTDYCN